MHSSFPVIGKAVCKQKRGRASQGIIEIKTDEVLKEIPYSLGEILKILNIEETVIEETEV